MLTAAFLAPKAHREKTGKPASHHGVVNQAFSVLLDYGQFTWAEKDGFRITRDDGRRLQIIISDAVKTGSPKDFRGKRRGLAL